MLRSLAVLLLVLTALLAAPAAQQQRWLLVSDIHLDPRNRGAAPSGFGHDTDPALFASAVRAMRAAVPDPRIVIVAGDVVAHRLPSSLHLPVERTVAHALGAAFPRSRFLMTLGNNDDPCGDYKIEPNSPYLRALAALWGPLIMRGGASPHFVREFARAGYYTASLPVRGERAVVLDSVLWSARYSDACDRRGDDPGRAELAWLDATLRETPAGTRNLVLMHVPPGIDAFSTKLRGGLRVVPFLKPADNAALLAALDDPRDRVTLAIAGHTHRLGLRQSDARDPSRDVPILVAPAISPIFGGAPSFVVLRVNGDGTVAGYDVYRFDGKRWRRAAADRPIARGGGGCEALALTVRSYARCAGIALGDRLGWWLAGLTALLAGVALVLALVRLARQTPRSEYAMLESTHGDH